VPALHSVVLSSTASLGTLLLDSINSFAPAASFQVNRRNGFQSLFDLHPIHGLSSCLNEFL
jgi:hypothetical protein